MERVRIGLIGAGGVARSRHLPALASIPEADLRLIWSRDPARAARVAEEFDIEGTAASWEEITESEDVDAVIVATPPVLHHPATLKALAAGKHVLSQARMARNLREAGEMLLASEAAPDLVTCLYPPLPGLKGDRVMARLLHDEGYVGDIREVRVTGMSLVEPSDGYSWQADPDVTGVNTMTMGMWAEVLDRWVGPAIRVATTGSSHNPRRRTADGRTVDSVVPDSLAIAADLECGATATYHFSTAAAFGPGSSIEIYGSKGALVYTLFKEEIHGATAGRDELAPIPVPPEEERHQTTDSEFVRAILEGTPVFPDFHEGMRYMEFSEAVAISLATGTTVPVPPPETMEAWGRHLDS